MTEEYKKQLIDYTTGLLNNQNPNPQDFNILNIDFKEYKDSFSDFFAELNQKAYMLRITGVLENENYDVSILYGAYLLRDQSASMRGRGFLIYLDKNNNVIDYLLEDKHGNALRGFHKLYFDSESNRVYGVVGHPTIPSATIDEPNYLTYVNNLFLKNNNGNYEYDTSTSFNLQDNDLSVKKIIKNSQNSYYLMISVEANVMYNIKVIEYKVNVGESNEENVWDIAGYNGEYGGYQWQNVNLTAYHLWYDEDTPHFKVIFGGLNYDLNWNYNGKYFAIATDNGENISYSRLNQIEDIIPNNSSAWNLSNYQLEVLDVNENEIYFVVVHENIDIDNNLYYQTRIYKYNGSTINTLYSSPSVSVSSNDYHNHDCYYYNFYIDNDGTIYLVRYYVEENTSRVYTGLLNFTKYYNDIGGNHWGNVLAQAFTGTDKIYSNFTFMQRSFNICKIYNIVGNISTLLFYQQNLTGYVMTITNLYNLSGYNGTPYISNDYLVPKSSNLYSNNVIVFSRNLYNVSIQDNTTTSSVEIPNNYLNDNVIGISDLIGKTNGTLVRDTNSWSKNIYEVVDLNFINTIDVIDEDTNTMYPLGANKINYATNTGGNTNYNNAPCLKYRINYSDSTSVIKSLSWSNINANNKRTNFIIYVDKEIDSIDLLSNDETTIYLHIAGTFTIGNYYTIKQKVRIGNKAEPIDLQYNNENVLYNNEQVQVIV